MLIAGGGTGGHVFPAIAIQEAIERASPHSEFLFIGTERGLESRVVPAHGKRLETIWLSGFSRSSLVKNVALPIKLAVSLWQSWRIVHRFNPDLAIGTGGYVMGPVLWVSQKLGIPSLLQEQNSLPGITTRKLAPRASAVCLGYEEAKLRLKAKKIFVTGNPVRSGFALSNAGDRQARWRLAAQRPTLLVFGGSLGARTLNHAVSDSLEDLLRDWNLIWQTGKFGTPARASAALMKEAIASRKLVVTEFIDAMPDAYAASDLAVCRAGAMTLAELAICGLPAILVPYPFAADDHQTENARSVERAGAALVISDSECSGKALSDAVRLISANPEQFRNMKTAMQSLARPNAAAEIARIALSLLEHT